MIKRFHFYGIVMLISTACDYIQQRIDAEVPKSVDVGYQDPRLDPLFQEVKKSKRDSLGFAPLDSNARIIYKEEGTWIKLFFQRPDYITILYFERDSSGLKYFREEEKITGPQKMVVKDVDGYDTEIQETINRIYDVNPVNLGGKTFRLTYLDLSKYRPGTFEYEPDEELSIEQAKAIITRWPSAR